MSPFVIRPATQDELPLVFDSWLKSFGSRGRSTALPNGERVRVDAQGLAPDLARYGHSRTIRMLVGESAVDVVALAELPEEAIGWVCYDARDTCIALHYIFVRSTARRHGAATALLAHVQSRRRNRPMQPTHLTPRGEALLQSMAASITEIDHAERSDRAPLVAPRS